MRVAGYSFFALWILLLVGCVSAGAKSPEERRQAVQTMKQEVLTELYETKPDVRSQIESAPGYAVFDNANVNVILASFGGGYGVLHDNQTGQDTYMRVGEVGIGFGVGVKDFTTVMIFHTSEAVEFFRERGWTFGAQADAAAKAGESGAAASEEAVLNNVTIYQRTESGLALQATVKGAKFWVDGDLNE